MHHNNIVNSSIIINIIVNGKNHSNHETPYPTTELPITDAPTTEPPATESQTDPTTEAPEIDAWRNNLVDQGWINVDPRYGVAIKQIAQPYDAPT